jgi:hypothetical protein
MLMGALMKAAEVEVEGHEDLLQIAVQIAAMLPRDRDAAMAVLDYVHDIADEFFEEPKTS